MVVRVMHTCEAEEADAWMWRVGSSISTPEVNSRADLKHSVGENLQELLHLEVGWSLMRLRELRLHRGIGFRGGRMELGRHERGVRGYNFARHLHQCEIVKILTQKLYPNHSYVNTLYSFR